MCSMPSEAAGKFRVELGVVASGGTVVAGTFLSWMV